MIDRRAVLAGALLVLGAGVAPSNSAVAESGSVLTAGAHIYELTESAKFILRGRRPSETSTSEFMGFVDPGTPPCPDALAAPVRVLPPDANGHPQRKCVVNMTGMDRISLVTGLGPISGRFTVVTADEINPTQIDAPETVVMQGTFRGQIDFSPALQVPPFPYGTVTGHLMSEEGERVDFFGVFLLPFEAAGGDVYLGYTLLSPELQVQLSGTVVPVQPYERALQYPTARFDLYFLPQEVGGNPPATPPREVGREEAETLILKR